MNDIMSYQYPPPGTPPPPYDAGYSIPPHSSGMDTRSPGQPGRHESEPSPTSFELKREPHPDVRMVEGAPGQEQANMGASGDKKRGKLQYQRISVACSKKREPHLHLHFPLAECAEANIAPKKQTVGGVRSGVFRRRVLRNATSVSASTRSVSSRP